MYYIEHVAWAKSRKGLIQAPYCFGLKRFLCAKMHLRKMSSAFFILNMLVRQFGINYELPSRERSHIPQKWHFESMIFRTSPGGICIHSLEGITTAIYFGAFLRLLRALDLRLFLDGWSRRNQEHHRRWRFLRRLRCSGHRSEIFPVVKLPGKTRKQSVLVK